METLGGLQNWDVEKEVFDDQTEKVKHDKSTQYTPEESGVALEGARNTSSHFVILCQKPIVKCPNRFAGQEHKQSNGDEYVVNFVGKKELRVSVAADLSLLFFEFFLFGTGAVNFLFFSKNFISLLRYRGRGLFPHYFPIFFTVIVINIERLPQFLKTGPEDGGSPFAGHLPSVEDDHLLAFLYIVDLMGGQDYCLPSAERLEARVEDFSGHFGIDCWEGVIHEKNVCLWVQSPCQGEPSLLPSWQSYSLLPYHCEVTFCQQFEVGGQAGFPDNCLVLLLRVLLTKDYVVSHCIWENDGLLFDKGHLPTDSEVSSEVRHFSEDSWEEAALSGSHFSSGSVEGARTKMEVDLFKCGKRKVLFPVAVELLEDDVSFLELLGRDQSLSFCPVDTNHCFWSQGEYWC